MNERAATKPERVLDTVGTKLARRYEVQALLGRGGMGDVYRVWDEAEERRVALKCLRPQAAQRHAALALLFEREYHTLKQLAHPSIIEVYDYGVSPEGPYYTMELLDGDDVRHLAPMPWREACSLLRDVASSLAVIHSRRLLHRDVSPGNVRCAPGGRAKLLDFGAMITMGTSGAAIGTPPCIAPEALNGQALDARADLYSLGALAYFAMTGRHAYPARSIAALRDMWRSRPAPVPSLAPDVPEALGELVLSLLSLEPLARPSTASEVIDRLAALADLPQHEPLAVTQAYLSMPMLVARDEHVIRFRKQVLRAARGRGSGTLVEGAPGMGRTRLLHALELEGKLAGATAVRVDAADAPPGDYGVIRGLAGSLFERLPELAVTAAEPYKHVLGSALPECHERLGRPAAAQVGHQDWSAQVQGAIAGWLEAMAQHQCLVLAIDDADGADGLSIAVLTVLCQRAVHRRLALVMAVGNEGESTEGPMLGRLRRAAPRITLPPLDHAATEQLVRSVFGEVPHVKRVADWVAKLAQGNPQTCMELCQHLVDQAIARYERGGWVLPASLREHELPSSFEESLDRRLERLSPPALELAQGLSLSSVPLELEEYVVLLGEGEGDDHQLFDALDELVGAGVFVIKEGAYAFSQRGYREAAQRTLDETQRLALERRLVTLFERRNDMPRQATHRLRAGDELGALSTMLQYYRVVGSFLGMDGAPQQLPALQWSGRSIVEDTTEAVRTREQLLEVCRRHGRPAREAFLLRGGLMTLASVYDLSLMRGHAERQIAQLRTDTGAIYWDEFAEVESAAERIRRCMDKAQKLYDAASEDQRVLTPTEAVGTAILVVGGAQGMGRQGYEVQLLRDVVAFAALLRPLGPRFEAVYNAALHSLQLVEGRVDEAAATRSVLLSYYDSLLASGQALHPIALTGRALAIQCEGFYQSARGKSEAERWAGMLASPSFSFSAQSEDSGHIWMRRAWEIRRLMHLYTGNAREARRCQEQVDRLSIQHAYAAYGGGSAHLEAHIHALSGDLMGLKQSIETIADITERQYPGWKPLLHAARGDYHQLRGEPSLSLVELERAIEATGPGQHAAWAPACASRVQVLVEMGAAERACEVAVEALQGCQNAELGVSTERELTRVLALAQGAAGRSEVAAGQLEALIEDAEREGLGGVPLGVLYETRARVAVMGEDAGAFHAFAERAGERYREGGSPALIAKHERLMHMASRRGMGDGFVRSRGELEPEAGPGLATELADCEDERQRYERALGWMLERTGATEGFLFLLRDGELELAATASPQDVPSGLRTALEAYVHVELDEVWEVTLTCFDQQLAGGEMPGWPARDGGMYRPVLLQTHRQGQFGVVGIAALLDHDDGFEMPTGDLISSISEVLHQDEGGEEVSMFAV